MVALKGADIDRFVAKPDPGRPVVLVYGPDTGLVRERAAALIKASVDDPSDPFMLARLEADDIAGEPGRLVEEANTIPLFGGRRAVWVKAGTRNFAAAVEALTAAAPPDCRVVIEAGDLRRSAPLRAICERAKNAAALPCYVDDERTLALLIDDEMRAAGITISPDARAALLPLLGGDRLVISMLQPSPTAGTLLVSLAEIGYTRQGSNFGKGSTGPECIVTGGFGSMKVEYQGQTYYVCCTGCRDLFNDDPEAVLADYRKRKEEEKAKKK